MEQGAFYRAGYWPLQARGLEQLLAGTGPLAAAQIEELGASSKGLFAIERLLFHRAAPEPLAQLAGPNGARRCQLLILLAADVARLAAAVKAGFASQGPGLAEVLARAPQASLDRLVTTWWSPSRTWSSSGWPWRWRRRPAGRSSATPSRGTRAPPRAIWRWR
jgi:predicted lipoprotein